MNTTIEVHSRIEPFATRWEALAQHTQAAPFLWPGWSGAWWRAFGRGRLQILSAYQDGQLAGVLPLYRTRGVLSSTTNPEAPLSGFLAANEAAADQLSHALFSKKPRRIDLSLVHPDDAGVARTRASAHTAGYRMIADTVQHSPYIDLSGTTWDAYESGLRRKFRSELRRRRRRLEEEGQLVLEVSDGTERLHELLEQGLRIEASGWKETRGTSINARPAARRFYTDVAQWAAQHGWLRLALLRLNGRPLAFDYCLECHGVHYLVKTGYDPAYRKFAPGMVIRYLMVARAFSEGLATYDFLGVPDAWKLEWTGAHQDLLALRLFAPTALGQGSRAVFVGGRSLSEQARTLAQSSIFPESGRRLLKRGHVAWHHWRDSWRVR